MTDETAKRLAAAIERLADTLEGQPYWRPYQPPAVVPMTPDNTFIVPMTPDQYWRSPYDVTCGSEPLHDWRLNKLLADRDRTDD